MGSHQFLFPTDWKYYALAVLLAGAITRLFVSLCRVIEYRHPPQFGLDGVPTPPRLSRNGCLKDFVWDFIGFHSHAVQRDWTQTFWLGLLEVFGYPIFIINGHPEAIAWWISLKTVPHWRQWLSHSESYVRFFLGNAAVIAGSLILVRTTAWV